MSQFTDPLICTVLDDARYKIFVPFTYYVGYEGSPYEIIVPDGFITDFASIPRIFWSILPPNGRYTKAAVIHDYLYQNAIHSKEYADKVFHEAMLVLGVNRRTAWIMYQAVKLFGKGNY